MSPRSLRNVMCRPRAVFRLGLACALLVAWPVAGAAQLATDRFDLTGRLNLTLGSGARAQGMGGAFLARADDATAASWNPAGLSYLRLPEVSLVGVGNRFDVVNRFDVSGSLSTTKSRKSDRLQGQSVDFAALTWPLAFCEMRGAVQLSYQRAISFDGRREFTESEIMESSSGVQNVVRSVSDNGSSDGGFDVIALGTGFRLTRGLRAGITLNRWLGGYSQHLARTVDTSTNRPQRELDLRFQPRAWNFNLGVMWSPIESLNVAAVYKTPFTASVDLVKSRRDAWNLPDRAPEVTTNAYSSGEDPALPVRLDFPSSFGFGLSWRARETVTLSADFTQTRWSKAHIWNYFDLNVTAASDEDGNPSPNQPPRYHLVLQYPSLESLPASGDTAAERTRQKDKQELRLGAEWVLIKGDLRIPLRAGYFNDRQILANTSGTSRRFNGLTVGLGLGVRSVLFDVAYVYQYGHYTDLVEVTPADAASGSPRVTATARNSVTINRFYASVIYRFPGFPGFRP